MQRLMASPHFLCCVLTTTNAFSFLCPFLTKLDKRPSSLAYDEYLILNMTILITFLFKKSLRHCMPILPEVGGGDFWHLTAQRIKSGFLAWPFIVPQFNPNSHLTLRCLLALSRTDRLSISQTCLVLAASSVGILSICVIPGTAHNSVHFSPRILSNTSQTKWLLPFSLFLQALTLLQMP